MGLHSEQMAEWGGWDLIKVLEEYFRKSCICLTSNLRLIPVFWRLARDITGVGLKP